MDDGLVVRAGTDEPHDIDGALGDFFTLEAAGWKGRAGTAARGDARVRDFLENAVGALAREGKVRIDRLLVDTDPIAVIVTLRSGARRLGLEDRLRREHSPAPRPACSSCSM